MSSRVLCSRCGSSLSSNWKVCSNCGLGLYTNMLGSSMTAGHNPTNTSIKDRMGVLAGWVCNKIMVACNSGPGQEWSEYEREHSENGSSDEYSKYHTDSEQTRRLSRKFIPPKQCLVPLEEDDTRSSMGSSTRDSGSLVGNLPSPARFFAQKEKRDAEIQTDTSTTLTKSSRSKKSRAIQSNDQQAPFLYRLMEDESKLKRIHIRRTKGSIKGSNNPPQIISYLPQMTQSSPATLFESFRKERDQQPKKIPGSVQIQRQKSHQLFHYEREGTYLTQQDLEQQQQPN